MQYYEAFLQTCIDHSKTTRVVLGPVEAAEERAIESSRSLKAFWKSLMAAAVAEILAPIGENQRITGWL